MDGVASMENSCSCCAKGVAFTSAKVVNTRRTITFMMPYMVVFFELLLYEISALIHMIERCS